MATNLKKTDVVIVGLGAAGGVAALPLARAGLNVIGLEAGAWLSARDFAPDELRNNFRGWPQSVQKANTEIPTHRPNASAPYSQRLPIHPMMNAVGGTSVHYWAQSWRLNPWDFKVVSETTQRYGAARIPKGSTVEDWPCGLGGVWSRTTTRWNTKSASRARRATSAARSIRAAIFSRVRASASIRCLRCGVRGSPSGWRLPRRVSAGTRFPARRRSIHRSTTAGLPAPTTATATGAGATP